MTDCDGPMPQDMKGAGFCGGGEGERAPRLPSGQELAVLPHSSRLAAAVTPAVLQRRLRAAPRPSLHGIAQLAGPSLLSCTTSPCHVTTAPRRSSCSFGH